jgi:hypothetical protein
MGGVQTVLGVVVKDLGVGPSVVVGVLSAGVGAPHVLFFDGAVVLLVELPVLLEADL